MANSILPDQQHRQLRSEVEAGFELERRPMVPVCGHVSTALTPNLDPRGGATYMIIAGLNSGFGVISAPCSSTVSLMSNVAIVRVIVVKSIRIAKYFPGQTLQEAGMSGTPAALSGH